MSRVTKKQFLADVRHEIDMLKLHATDAEKARLDFETLSADSKYDCIYGQMTGHCKSHRASELINLCCIRVVKNEGWLDEFDSILPKVNGVYNKSEWDINRGSMSYLSSLEGYIMAATAKNAQIIAYIKGETETLTL